MNDLKVGDIVTRKSYGGDMYFRITDIVNMGKAGVQYILRGLFYRITADSTGEDLIKQDSRAVFDEIKQNYRDADEKSMKAVRSAEGFFRPRAGLFGIRPRMRPGKVLHIDSSEEYLEMCIEKYRKARIQVVGVVSPENEQPAIIRRQLQKNKPDIIVITGHDSMKKNANKLSIESYRTSKYYIQSVREARLYEADYDKLCIFAGACQSYYEAIMEAGANFASAPGRVLINALDPELVAERVALTDSKSIVTGEQVAATAISGRDGIGGRDTKGRLTRL